MRIRGCVLMGFALALMACVAPLGSRSLAWAQNQDQTNPEPPPAPGTVPQQYTPLTQQQLQQLAAPIALYPDSLVAQILAASTYPAQIVEAERFLQSNPGLTGQDLANQVNQQDWDPSVKALVQFPTVLSYMDQNLSWTSALGDAYYNQPQDVMNTIQDLRRQAQQAGNLNSTNQQIVTQQGPNVIIQPASPNVVYVPEYDPWSVYGYPIPVYPGWVWTPGLFWNRPGISFGLSFGIAPFFGFAWGWPAWRFDWYHHGLLFGHAPYVFRGHTFFDRNNFYRGGPVFRPGPGIGRPGFERPNLPGRGAYRGFQAPRGAPGVRSGPFSGFDRGGDTRGFSARGRASMGAPRGGVRGGGIRGGGRGR